ncbi:50S ribosomal protein L29 [Candidatus Woesearchaeota archaeon]|nr:50S ribosomal protein L29 [Candidatus Woesearchaeota archaeon]
MKIKELQSLPEKEREEKLKEVYKELMKENTQIATGTQIKNPGKVKQLKKTIARIKMLATQKKVAKQ